MVLPNVAFQLFPTAILDRKVKSLRNKEINQVKVKWEHRKGSDTTWESEEEMQRLYPTLFVLKMADKGNDDAVPRVTEQMREMIAEEVGKAIENSLSSFFDKIQNTVLSVVDERIKKLEDSANIVKEKSGGRKPCSYKEFMACKPPVYNGEVDPIICQGWLSDIEGVFERTHCDTNDYTPFLKHHSPKAVINRIKEEFMQLRHKGESVDKITGMFMDKMKFCDELYETLTEIINVAREREIELKKQVERGERRAHDVNPSPTKKARTNEIVKKSDAKGGSPSCKICEKGHKGECRFKDKPCPICRKTGHMASSGPDKVTVCYKCYRPGHKKSECPELVGKNDGQDTKGEAPKVKARSFHLTATEAKIEPEVVSGIFALPMPLEVEIGNNKSFIICDVCQNCKLNIDNEEYSIDLIPMSMGEIQVIVGMDWLSRYHAKVACFWKEIKLTSPSGKHVTIYGEKGGNPVVCTMLEVHRLMKHGCKSYMVYASESEKESPKIGDVPVVRDYEDVFPEDLPRIPPEREVELESNWFQAQNRWPRSRIGSRRRNYKN
ncbi:uncharacterized protein LOC110900251 [Helianthus annuus]|uniref:uncharacterized protein LOC110900251 n=1 Tax=Helianthus annuus TaxID=4232 RepID=UPI000B8F0414|nr:uncharacterized protein LOC110900251 [Helianthus annuus]